MSDSSTNGRTGPKDVPRLGILCGGGPAPGINSVIGAATICAALAGAEVIGIRDGFKWLMRGDTERTVPLTIEQVSRIHFTGGSYLGTARANPTRDERDLGATIKRRMDKREDGTAVLAEGLVEHLSADELATFGQIEHDEHGHVRLAEINLGEVVKERLRQRLAGLGISTTVAAKDIGYELR